MHATQDNDRLNTSDPPILLAIMIAARKTGDRLLESVVRRELEAGHKIKISFARDFQKSGAAASGGQTTVKVTT